MYIFNERGRVKEEGRRQQKVWGGGMNLDLKVIEGSMDTGLLTCLPGPNYVASCHWLAQFYVDQLDSGYWLYWQHGSVPLQYPLLST